METKIKCPFCGVNTLTRVRTITYETIIDDLICRTCSFTCPYTTNKEVLEREAEKYEKNLMKKIELKRTQIENLKKEIELLKKILSLRVSNPSVK